MVATHLNPSHPIADPKEMPLSNLWTNFVYSVNDLKPTQASLNEVRFRKFNGQKDLYGTPQPQDQGQKEGASAMSTSNVERMNDAFRQHAHNNIYICSMGSEHGLRHMSHGVRNRIHGNAMMGSPHY